MNLENRKIELINWITLINSEEVINNIESIKNKENDWWNKVPEVVQNEIDESIEQANSGNYTDHKKQVEKFKTYL